MKNLDKKILERIINKTGLSVQTIRNAVSGLAPKYPKATKNALAHIYATQKGVKIWGMLDEEDKESAPSSQTQISGTTETVKRAVKKAPKKKELKVIDYETNNTFKKGHIDEFHRAYNNGCYTSCLILARKIVENLIIDILKKKFSERIKKNRELYWIDDKGRHQDFSVILDNLYNKRTKFNSGKEIVEKLYKDAKFLKGAANKSAHSWYHLVKKRKDIDDNDIGNVIDLIKELEDYLKIKR